MATRTTSLIALAIASLSSSPLLAQSLPTDAGENRSGDIVVNAQRLADTALKEQSAAINILNIQSAETIAKYPDVNAAEALSRIPGVALSIDTSEGRFVNIRGLDGNLNGATFGGVVLLNTQPGGTYFNAAGRAVEFDTVPIGAIDRIVVIKTGLPDHDAEGIGGSVELTPRTAIGMHKPFAEVTLGGGIETFKGTGLYRDEVVLGAPFGGKNVNGDAPFSVVVSQFLYNDRRTFDDIEAAYKDTPGVPNKAFDALELRKYGYNRKRFGYSGEFDFTPNAEQRLYVRGSLAGYNEHVSRNRLSINGLGDAVTVDPANPNGFIATGVSTEKTLRDEEETHRNMVVQIGGDHHFGALHVDWFAAYSRATYHKLYDYNSTFSGASDLTVAYDNISDPNHPKFGVTSGASITDPANYSLSSIGNQSEYSRDREWSYAINVGTPIGLATDDELKIGGKLRYRHKSSLPYSGSYTSDTNPSLAQFAAGGAVTNFYHNGYNIGPVINGSGLRQIFDASGTPLALNEGSFFDDNEDVSAAYAQYRASFGSLGVLAGIRFEHTSAIYSGIGDTLSGVDVIHGPLTTKHSYDNWFPTLQLRYQAMPELVLRATYSTGLARPGFFQTIQATSIDTATNTVTTGNPDLKPTYSHNFDIGAEYRLPGGGLISVGAFDKELKNYVVSRRGTSFPGLTGVVTVNTFENVPNAHVRGLEGSFMDKFTGLPGMLGGLGIDANITYVDSSVALRDGETVALPGTFKWSWNAAVFYERGPVKMRLSPQYESSVLFGVGSTRATDIFQDHRFTLDFNGSYDISRNVQVYFNAKNLTNAPLRFYEGTSDRPTQREFYDVTLEGGIKLHL